MTNASLVDLTLYLADSTLVLGQRNGDWCGHGPVLEQDIAITNITLDLIGQARSFYQYAAQLIGKTADPETRALTDMICAESDRIRRLTDRIDAWERRDTADGSPAEQAAGTHAAAAAADVLCWRRQVLADWQRAGVLTLDCLPSELTAKLVSEYLEIKARNRL